MCFGVFYQYLVPIGTDVKILVKQQNLEPSKINAPPANYQQF